MGDEARSKVESGSAAIDLPDSPSQVGFSTPSLLPLEKPVVPVVMMCSDSDVGMDEKGEGMVCSVQRNVFLPGTDCIDSVADISGLSADAPGGELRVPLVRGGGQAEAVQLGDPLTDGVRLSIGAPLTVGEGLGQPSIKAVAAFSGFAAPMAQSAEKGSGVRGGSGHSFAPLTELDEDFMEAECEHLGDLDREGHRLASSCVDAVLDAGEVTRDGREKASGGKRIRRGRGGRRGGGRTRGRAGSRQTLAPHSFLRACCLICVIVYVHCWL
ncbi:hypothetical protein Dimus_024712 [Dionaea muscipula]